MKKSRSIKDQTQKRTLRLAFTGFTMGLADLVPGVSGGTIAFLFGIYDELLYSIKLLTGDVVKLVVSRRFKDAYRLIPFGFLIPVALGIFSAIFGFVRVVTYLLDTQPVLVWSLFFGLVLGSAYVVSRRIAKWNARRLLLLILGFLLTFVLVGLPSINGSESPLIIFGTGAIAITAMILPGISGSLIMVLLGQYEVVISAVSERNLVLLSIFAAGAITGLALFVRLLTWLLKNYHSAVIAFLIGVMAGSLRRIWPWQSSDGNNSITYLVPAIEPRLLGAVLLVIAGFGIVCILERFGIAKEHDDIKTKEFKKELQEIKS